MSNTETIDQPTLERLVEAGVVHGADVVGHAAGWGLVVRYGKTQRTLCARRGDVRTWRKLETLVAFLKGLGVEQFSVNAADFDPVALKARRIRPDSAARMRSAFEASAHTGWMLDKVAASLADLRPNRTHDQAMTQAQAIIDAKRQQQHAGKAGA